MELERVIELSNFLIKKYVIERKDALALAVQIQRNEVLSLYNKLYIRENEYPNSFDNIATELREAKEGIISIMCDR